MRNRRYSSVIRGTLTIVEQLRAPNKTVEPSLPSGVGKECHASPSVSDELWTIIAPLLPPEPPKPKGGRLRIPDRACLPGTSSSS
jgi:hypothetical protein